MHKYRTHNCGELNLENVHQSIKLSGWVHRARDHGNLLFIDIRDHYGITQLVFSSDLVESASLLKSETVITIVGEVVARDSAAINENLKTGKIEVRVQELNIESLSEPLPLPINLEQELPEDTRLKYRFLDLRREKIHSNIILRSQIIAELRHLMIGAGFMEFQTPILTASSPEGARDFLVPSRLHPGKFYALPQAPQQFKQLLMVSGFDKYFQIAPCFRDEDARSDRSPGEFYQLDIEMSFVTQEDIFRTIEPIMYGVFNKFGNKIVSSYPFRQIPYQESMLKYGNDKPDLRNPINICDVTSIFTDSNFAIFVDNIKKGAVVRAIPAPKATSEARSFFDKMNDFATAEGAKGLGYIQFMLDGSAKGPIVKFLNIEQLDNLKIQAKITNGDVLFFVCDKENNAVKLAGKIRTKLGEELNLIDKNRFELCWITDFPFYEMDETTGKIDFNHNPFSMPQGGIKVLEKASNNEELLAIKAYQYDIVCNGIELSSGAVRNHHPELMYKAFALVGYDKSEVDDRFGGMINAFKFGAPPHGGIAPGIDRIVMLISESTNIREVIAFPMNQQGQDLLMSAPSTVNDKQLKELNIMLSPLAIKKLNSNIGIE